MDALNTDFSEPASTEEPVRRRRRRANPLVDAIRAVAPSEREAAIDAALAEVLAEERRQELLARVAALPTDALEQLLAVR